MLQPRHRAIAALLLALAPAGCATPTETPVVRPVLAVDAAIITTPADYGISAKRKPRPTPAPTATPTPAPTTSTYTPALTDAQWTVARQVLALTNQQRAAAGAAALVLDTPLMGMATFRSQDMASRHYFSHYDPEGHTVFWHMTQAGIPYGYAAENIAYGYATADAVVTAWMNSSGHRANILNPNLAKLGVGYVKNSSGTPYWTQVFTD